MNTTSRALRVSALSVTGLVVGAALLPAGSAFAAASDCGSDGTLVADGICEVTFLEGTDVVWTPPAGITKLQALLVGAGGASGAPNGNWGYSGGGGEVTLVELANTGDVTLTVGLASAWNESVADGYTFVEQGSDSFQAAPGLHSSVVNGNSTGGESGNGNETPQGYGGGSGAGGIAGFDYWNAWSGGPGLVVNEIDPSTFDLFANDDECLGAGGSSIWIWIEGSNLKISDRATDCNRNLLPEGIVGIQDPNNITYLLFENQVDNILDFDGGEPTPGSGTGGSSWANTAINNNAMAHQMGADGKVVLRYDVALAETGFDATGAIAAGAALFAGGVALAARRRRVTN